MISVCGVGVGFLVCVCWSVHVCVLHQDFPDLNTNGEHGIN